MGEYKLAKVFIFSDQNRILIASQCRYICIWNAK